MPFDRFLIAPINKGLTTNTKPWLLPDDAFEFCKNAYVWRQRVRKRFGSQLIGTTQQSSQLRVRIGTTGGAGNLAATNLPGNGLLAIGQTFSVGTGANIAVFTVYQLGHNVATLTTFPTITATVDTTPNPNQITINGDGIHNLNTPVYWYPSQPVMGLFQYDIGTVNNHPTYAFDTQFAYVYTPGTGWSRSGTALWTGGNLNYFWVFNWEDSFTNLTYMFVSNFNFTLGAGQPGAGPNNDPIWTYDGATWVARTGAVADMAGFFFLPPGLAPYTGPFVQTALIIVSFKGRMIFLNTVENDNSSHTGTGTATQYPQRARYSAQSTPFAVNAWYEGNLMDTAGNIGQGAGFTDATTSESIIGAEFIKDRLIVYFERSTYELAPTQNDAQPFLFQKLNTELGSQSTYSTVPFDQAVLAIGNTGVHSCNGSNVARIDNAIPDTVFEFETENNATTRTCGIREYYDELVYWTYVSDQKGPYQVFPDQVLVYNYQNDTWSINDDCYTTFGYFEQGQDVTWESSFPYTWANYNGAWNSNVLQANQRQVIGGTPEGFVLKLSSESSRNAPSMYITNIVIPNTGIITLTIIDHELNDQPTQEPYDRDYILIENIAGDPTVANYLNGNIYDFTVVDANTITINTGTFRTPTGQPIPALTTGVYLGGGTCARVSNQQIDTKTFNPYLDKNMNVYVSKMDFAVERTVSGAITVDYFTSTADLPMINEAQATASILGNNILETYPYPTLLDPADPMSFMFPLEQYQETLWHPVYFQSQGEFIQLSLYLSRDQMLNPAVSLAPFELQAMCLYTMPSGTRMQ